jgi:hypothetical protein
MRLTRPTRRSRLAPVWRILRFAPLLLLSPLIGGSSCPLTLNPGEDGGVADASVSSDGGSPARSVTFDSLEAGEFQTKTIDGVTLIPMAYQGNQTILVQDSFSKGQDLWLQCGQLIITAPELHQAFDLVFNDDSGTLVVSVYDQNGQLLTDQAVDTRRDAAATGITSVDEVYKKLTAQMASSSERRIARVEVASCYGALHKILLQ